MLPGVMADRIDGYRLVTDLLVATPQSNLGTASDVGVEMGALSGLSDERIRVRRAPEARP